MRSWRVAVCIALIPTGLGCLGALPWTMASKALAIRALALAVGAGMGLIAWAVPELTGGGYSG